MNLQKCFCHGMAKTISKNLNIRTPKTVHGEIPAKSGKHEEWGFLLALLCKRISLGLWVNRYFSYTLTA